MTYHIISYRGREGCQHQKISEDGDAAVLEEEGQKPPHERHHRKARVLHRAFERYFVTTAGGQKILRVGGGGLDG